MEGHAPSCPKCQDADSAAPSKSTTTNTRCEITIIDGEIVYWRS